MTEPRPRLATVADSKSPLAPRHLSASSRAWWADVMKTYQLEAHHIRLLTLACEAWDRAEEARLTIDRDGAYFMTRFKEPRPHPAISVERDARLAFARLLRELAFDVAVEPSRPPALKGRRGHAN